MIHVYHGDGKGKTTAAMGLALRALGNGWRVCVVQFLKGSSSGEVEILAKIPGATILRGKNSAKFSFQMNDAEKAAAREAHAENLAKAVELLQNGGCDMLVLDEAMGALSTGLLDEGLVRDLLADIPENAELVLTGRNPPTFVLDIADYSTEMKCVRHPYEKGVAARKGVEF